MTHLHAREYDPEDFTAIELPEPVKLAREGQPVEQWALEHKLSGPAMSVVDPAGAIVFCCGLHPMGWAGTAELWAVFSPLARQYPHATLRMGQRMRDYYQDKFARIQCAVDPQWVTAVRFVEYLGFKREGMMKQYGPNGRDMALYALVREASNG